MNRILRNLFFPHKPESSLITVEISKQNLLHNISEFQKLNGSIAPVLKSNAYGHGFLEVAHILEEASVPFFVVDSYFEAHTLRYNGIKKPIVIIGYTEPHIIKENKLQDISFVITNSTVLKDLADMRKDVLLHIKIDTGMRRQGLLPLEMLDAIGICKANPHLILDGICTHFSDADNKDTHFTLGQITTWNILVSEVKESFPEISFFHVSNTAGHAHLNEAISNVSRLGIGLYGLASYGEVDTKLSLQPVMEVKTKITGIKELKEGETAGYNNTFKAKKNMRIATIPMGYFEGIDRRLSNKGCVQVGGSYAPIIGRVSMNITIIDVTKISNVEVGAEVLVISNNPQDKNSINVIAQKCKTISYVIAVHIERGLKRVIKG